MRQTNPPVACIFTTLMACLSKALIKTATSLEVLDKPSHPVFKVFIFNFIYTY